MSTMASEITSLTIVYSTVYSGADQRKYQSSASLAFVRGIHWWPEISPHKGPVTRKIFPFDDDIIMLTSFPSFKSDCFHAFDWVIRTFCQFLGGFFSKKADHYVCKAIAVVLVVSCCQHTVLHIIFARNAPVDGSTCSIGPISDFRCLSVKAYALFH